MSYYNGKRIDDGDKHDYDLMHKQAKEDEMNQKQVGGNEPQKQPHWGKHCPNCKFLGTFHHTNGKVVDVYATCAGSACNFLIADKKHQEGDYTTTDDLTIILR